jgi:uncharacterized protein YjbI with pentapeptide repeats
MAARWFGQESRLAEISKRILSEDSRWDRLLAEFPGANPINNIESGGGAESSSQGKYEYSRDLRGLKFTDLRFDGVVNAWHYTRLEYSEFFRARFDTGEPRSTKFEFFENNLSHSRFADCTFQSCTLRGGHCKNAVFSHCRFQDFMFKANEEALYSNILFLNCTFVSVDFSGLDLATCCFWGNCTFRALELDMSKLYSFEPIGSNIVQDLTAWDSLSWSSRRMIKRVEHTYRAGCDVSDKTITYHHTGQEDTSREKRYVSSIHCFEGLSRFYEYVLSDQDLAGRHDDYVRAHFVLYWLRDEMFRLRDGLGSIPRSY